MENVKEILINNAKNLTNKELISQISQEKAIVWLGVYDKCDLVDLWVEVQLEKLKPKPQLECSICYDKLGNSNTCATPCGHNFCFECMMKALNTNHTCPCCRAPLKDEVVYNSDSDSDSDSDESEINLDYDENGMPIMPIDDLDTINNLSRTNNHIATPEMLSEAIKKKGYTMEDVIVMWTWRVNRLNRRYNQTFLKKMMREIPEIIAQTDMEKHEQEEEREMMKNEDKRQIDCDDMPNSLRQLFETD